MVSLSQQPPAIYTPTDIPSLAPSYNLTPTEVATLSHLASAAKATAYCPYSRFRVGAALLTSDGQYFSGANIENASYPVGTCAERVALGKAVTDLAEAAVATAEAGSVKADGGKGGFGVWLEGQKNKTSEREGRGGQGGFKALAVSTDISPPASPCGMCRQFIREFCELDMPLWLFDKDGSFQVVRLEQLLPMSFGPEHLPAPI